MPTAAIDIERDVRSGLEVERGAGEILGLLDLVTGKADDHIATLDARARSGRSRLDRRDDGARLAARRIHRRNAEPAARHAAVLPQARDHLLGEIDRDREADAFRAAAT